MRVLVHKICLLYKIFVSNILIDTKKPYRILLTERHKHFTSKPIHFI